MRNDFVKQILVEMKNNSDIVFLSGDLGFNALESLQDAFPDRFFNVGIAEANMVGMASGLALSGKKVIAYSIASFVSMRCYEQIRNDVCYHNLDVKIIGVGGGFNYSDNGVTHHTVEDIAIMNVLPNMTVLCPAYSWEAREATKAIIKHNGPSYMRLGKSPGIDFSKTEWNFELGKGFVIKEGRDILLISTGNILDRAIAVAEMIEHKSTKKVCVLSLPAIKPLDSDLILQKAKKSIGIFTIEEHSAIGGLGSAVATTLAHSNIPKKPFYAFGFPDKFIKDVGNREYLCDIAGLSPKIISREIILKLKLK